MSDDNISIAQVTVSVDAGGQVHCDPDPVVVTQKNTRIDFVLATSGYAFPQKDAVVVSDPGDEFPFPSETRGPQQAQLLDKCSCSGQFTYTVTVVETASGRRLQHDPGIQNGTANPLPACPDDAHSVCC